MSRDKPMATRSYRPAQNAPITDGSQILKTHAHKIATEQLIPRIAERNKVAVETTPIKIYFYSAIQAGRRCSCWDIENSPDKQCTACFGTGIVGGFEKYGTTLEVIDVTKTNMMSTNILPDWTTRRKPIPFVLVDGARHGTLEAKVKLTSNIGKLDALYVSTIQENGNDVDLFIKSPADLDWQPMTFTAMEQRLHNPHVWIRMKLSRLSTNTPSPLLKSMYIRYQNMENNVLDADVPRAEKSIALQEFGVMDEWTRMRFWMPNILKKITTEDFIVSVEGTSYWKIISVTPFEPHGQLTSWDVDTRIIQGTEPYRRVPK